MYKIAKLNDNDRRTLYNEGMKRRKFTIMSFIPLPHRNELN